MFGARLVSRWRRWSWQMCCMRGVVTSVCRKNDRAMNDEVQKSKYTPPTKKINRKLTSKQNEKIADAQCRKCHQKESEVKMVLEDKGISWKSMKSSKWHRFFEPSQPTLLDLCGTWAIIFHWEQVSWMAKIHAMPRSVICWLLGVRLKGSCRIFALKAKFNALLRQGFSLRLS